ncbi:hypothetical protein, partial [Okeania sp. SIO2B9]|uniref:hypothetical protein n=1 Tax=Okeania sp. SIO2B9 TaxID=2607782 RepID=UPI00257DC9FA
PVVFSQLFFELEISIFEAKFQLNGARFELIVGKHSAISNQLSAIKMNEPGICLTSTTFLNKELKHKNNELKFPTKGNKADS